MLVPMYQDDSTPALMLEIRRQTCEKLGESHEPNEIDHSNSMLEPSADAGRALISA